MGVGFVTLFCFRSITFEGMHQFQSYFTEESGTIKGIYLSKALTCIKFFLYKQKMLFIKETDTFGHIVV